MFAFLKRLFRWFVIEPRFFWFMSALFAVLLLFIWSLPSEANVRYAGLFLQVLGISTVAWELNETYKHFGQPGYRKRFLEWLRRFPKSGKHVLGAVGVASGSSVVQAYLTTWTPDKPGTSIEDRLNDVVKNQERFIDEIQTLRTSTNQRIDQQVRELVAEKKERERQGQSIRDELEQAHTGNLHISMRGLIFLLIGVTLATLSDEIVCLITYMQ